MSSGGIVLGGNKDKEESVLINMNTSQTNLTTERSSGDEMHEIDEEE
jgi:hypothetical protein